MKYFAKPVYLVLGIFGLILLVAIVLGSTQPASPVSSPNASTVSTNIAPSPTTELEKINLQLADVENKILELPELEKDAFTKCMEGKIATAVNLKSCEESTQKSIFTLSQELTNLKNSLEARKKDLE